jgi:hypothetical protein
MTRGGSSAPQRFWRRKASRWSSFRSRRADGERLQNLYRLIETGCLAHDGDPVLRAHVCRGITKQTERGWRLVKDPKLARPIDALIALAMAVAGGAEPGQEPAFAFA